MHGSVFSDSLAYPIWALFIMSPTLSTYKLVNQLHNSYTYLLTFWREIFYSLSFDVKKQEQVWLFTV